MTTTTNLLFGNYEVTAGPAYVTAEGKAITGEYVLTGKKGAQYVTFRWANGSTFQFARMHNMTFCALKGNLSLDAEFVARHAVTLTDADRI